VPEQRWSSGLDVVEVFASLSGSSHIPLHQHLIQQQQQQQQTLNNNATTTKIATDKSFLTIITSCNHTLYCQYCSDDGKLNVTTIKQTTQVCMYVCHNVLYSAQLAGPLFPPDHLVNPDSSGLTLSNKPHPPGTAADFSECWNTGEH